MKYFLLFLFFFSSHAFSEEAFREVVILTSIKNPEIRAFWRIGHYEISEDIEEQFRDYFKGSGHRIVIKHQASALTLQKYLLSPKTVALFWVSHSRGRVGVTKQTISDFYGNNISDVFKSIHPNMKFLGLVGCTGDPILKENRASGFYDSNPNLITHSFKEEVRMNKGIRLSVKASAEILDRDPTDFLTYKKIERNDKMRRLQTRQSMDAPISLLTPMLESESNKLMPFRNGLHITLTNIEELSLVTIKNIFLGIYDPRVGPSEFIIPMTSFHRGKFKLKISKLKSERNEVKKEGYVQLFIHDPAFEELIKRQMPDSNDKFKYIIPSRP